MKQLFKYFMMIFIALSIAAASSENATGSGGDSNGSLMSAGIGFLGAILGAAVGGGATYFIEKYKIENLEYEKRKQIYSQLMGQKIMIRELYITLGENITMNNYYKIKCSKEIKKLDDDRTKDRTVIDEFDRRREKTESLCLEVARNNQHLFEIIRLIQILFPDVADDKIEKIKGLHEKIIPLIKNAGSNIGETKSIEIKSKIQREKNGIRESLGKEIDAGFKDMIEYLKKVVKDYTVGIKYVRFICYPARDSNGEKRAKA